MKILVSTLVHTAHFESRALRNEMFCTHVFFSDGTTCCLQDEQDKKCLVEEVREGINDPNEQKLTIIVG
jgi:hypothetical protein